ncbi:SPOR domain-containing protein [Treponema pectinovorum]|uniref:SPOR domain-containing protein n=1 Tax=Treponema pectinovorum TaxID=164 RepID=UPI003D8E7184
MKKIVSFILTAFTVTVLFAVARPSLDGRAVVADEGQMPKGLFARTIGYLPGDSVTVTNPANGSTVDVLILGSIDSSEGVAILLSPEAAENLSIKKDSNVQVKITKRTGNLDENVFGTAVLSEEENPAEISENTESEIETTSQEEQNLSEEDKTQENDVALEEKSQTEAIVAEDASETERIEVEENKGEIIENSDTSELLNESTALPEKNAENPETENPQVIEEDAIPADAMDEQKAELDNLESESQPNPVAEEKLESAPIAPVESEAQPIGEAVARENLPNQTEENLESVSDEIPEYEEDSQKEIVDEKAPEIETSTPEVVESETLPQDEKIQEESVEKEELPEVEQEKEAVDSEKLFPEPQERAKISEEEKIDGEQKFEEKESYEPIVLVPTELNPPAEESGKEEETRKNEENSPETETVSVTENLAEVEPFVKVEDERSIHVENQAVIETLVSPKEEKLSKTPDKKLQDYVKQEISLQKGKYYLQIATLSSVENIEKLLSRYADKYPVVLTFVEEKNVYKVLIGPLTVDEYGMIKERFVSYGFKDAFLRKIK